MAERKKGLLRGRWLQAGQFCQLVAGGLLFPLLARPGQTSGGVGVAPLRGRGRIALCRWSELCSLATASDHVWTKAAACKLPLLWSVAILPSGTFSHHTAPGHLRPLSPSLSRIVVFVLQVSGGPWVRKMFRMNPQPSLKDSLETFLWRKA